VTYWHSYVESASFHPNKSPPKDSSKCMGCHGFTWIYTLITAGPRAAPGGQASGVPGMTYPTCPEISTSTSRMWLLQLEAVAVGLPEGSLPNRRSTEMVMPLTRRSKEPWSFLEEVRQAVVDSSPGLATVWEENETLNSSHKICGAYLNRRFKNK
jgi:hypothetical protein